MYKFKYEIIYFQGIKAKRVLKNTGSVCWNCCFFLICRIVTIKTKVNIMGHCIEQGFYEKII